jgi:hypothetical protein
MLHSVFIGQVWVFLEYIFLKNKVNKENSRNNRYKRMVTNLIGEDYSVIFMDRV